METIVPKRTYRKHPKCPDCGHAFTTTELGAMLSAMKRIHTGGRPRDPDKPRCQCGAMTANRAKKTGHHCERAPKA